MKKSIIWFFILIVGIGGLSIYGYQRFTSWKEHKVQMESQVLLERIQKVSKLIAVEGHFSEIVDYKDYWAYDWLPFQKKALLRVQAKVSVGFDLQKMELHMDSEKQQIIIGGVPEPEILSLEHDLDYYDLQAGVFNTFTTEDYNKVQDYAKEEIRKQALASNLFDAAREQGNEALSLIEILAETAGYEVVFKEGNNSTLSN